MSESTGVLEYWNVGMPEYREIGVFAIISVLHHANRSLMIPMTQESDEAPLAQELRLISGVRTKVSEPLARYTSMKVGGPADVFIEVESAEALTKSFADSPSIRDKFLSPG